MRHPQPDRRPHAELIKFDSYFKTLYNSAHVFLRDLAHKHADTGICGGGNDGDGNGDDDRNFNF